jgi:hypothetical protein
MSEYSKSSLGAMHAPISVAKDTPAFKDVRATHNVGMEPGYAGYKLHQVDDTNAVLVNATLADGTQVSLWPDGTIQLTGAHTPERSTNFRIQADDPIITGRFQYLGTIYDPDYTDPDYNDIDYESDPITDDMVLTRIENGYNGPR